MAEAKKKARPDKDEWRMRLEIEAAKVLRAQIAEMTAGADADPDLIRDMIEGELSFEKLLDKLIENDARDKELIDGIALHQQTLAARKARVEKRKESRRALMLNAMQLAEMDKHECAEGTLSRRKTPVSLEVKEEADIPASFWRDPPPVLDKKALLDALKALEDENAVIIENWNATGSNEPPPIKTIPGAELKPAGETIAIR